MNKYKKLVSNTFIFGIGTFSSKLLVFFMMPLYTNILTVKQYGTADLIIQVCNFLLPITSLGITNAVIRYGLDKRYKKSDVLTTSIIVISVGNLLFLLISPFLKYIDVLENYGLLIFIFIVMSNFKGLFSQFVRAKQYVKLYSFDGILSTLTTIIFTIVFLVNLNMGIKGYIFAIILSDFISILFLFSIASLYKYIDIKNLNLSISKEMIKYSIPLIPTTIFWWIINISDRFLLTNIHSIDENGLYAVAYKIPTLITLISTIFLDAWQMSAIVENKNREKFFSKVFSMYSSLIFVIISFLILNAKLFTKILVSESFYESWKYIPILAIATGFSCFASFFGSIYMVNKKSLSSLITLIIGGIINIILNIILIPQYSGLGAATATLISFLVIFFVRLLDTTKYIKLKINLPIFGITLILIFIQSIINETSISFIIFTSLLILHILSFLLNIPNKKGLI